MADSRHFAQHPVAPCTPEAKAGVRIVRRHHLLVRCSHWLNIPILLGLILSGVSIYWTSPVYQHKPDPQTGIFDRVADIGVWICAHIAGQQQYSSPPDWVYNHFSLGPGMLAVALRLHWFCAYLFMLNGVVYAVGLAMGGGWRSLLPRRSDLRNATTMFLYYVSIPFRKLAHRTRLRPRFNSKYNVLQRAAYFSIPTAGLLSVLTGWAIHKPMQLYWLTWIFGGYDKSRIWHFWLMWVFILFVVPHVILVLADGSDTFRSMITGWSARVKKGGGLENEAQFKKHFQGAAT